MTKIKDGFMDKMELAVSNVLDDGKATIEQRMKAAEIGLKLLQTKHKISGSEGDTGSFFNK